MLIDPRPPLPYLCTNQLVLMELSIINFILSVLAILIAVIALVKRAPAQVSASEEVFNSRALQLQAYERLVLLCERIAIPNLIHRLNIPNISAMEMKMILAENIRQEFDYNSTQQLYVTAVTWDAVRNLKEQNIMLVNRVASSLPPDASSGELNKKILEVLMSDPGANLHELVLQSLNFEARKLMDKK